MDAEAVGEEGVDTRVLHLLLGQLRRVPPAPAHRRRLLDSGEPEELLRHARHGRAAHAGHGAELARARHMKAMVSGQFPAVGADAVAHERRHAAVGEEPPERGGEGVALSDLEDEAPAAHAELQRARPRLAPPASARDGGVHCTPIATVSPAPERGGGRGATAWRTPVASVITE